MKKLEPPRKNDFFLQTSSCCVLPWLAETIGVALEFFLGVMVIVNSFLTINNVWCQTKSGETLLLEIFLNPDTAHTAEASDTFEDSGDH